MSPRMGVELYRNLEKTPGKIPRALLPKRIKIKLVEPLAYAFAEAFSPLTARLKRDL